MLKFEMFQNAVNSVIDSFVVMDSSINFSDHLPITAQLITNHGLNVTDNISKITDNDNIQ